MKKQFILFLLMLLPMIATSSNTTSPIISIEKTEANTRSFSFPRIYTYNVGDMIASESGDGTGNPFIFKQKWIQMEYDIHHDLGLTQAEFEKYYVADAAGSEFQQYYIDGSEYKKVVAAPSVNEKLGTIAYKHESADETTAVIEWDVTAAQLRSYLEHCGTNVPYSVTRLVRFANPTGYKDLPDVYVALVAGRLSVVNSYKLSVTANGNGSVTYNDAAIRNNTATYTVNEGSSATFTFTPDSGYRLGNVKVNRNDVTSIVTNNQYSIKTINKNTIIEIAFVTSPYDFKVEGLCYRILSKEERTVELTWEDLRRPYKGSIVIPSMVENNGLSYKVTSIGNRAFSNVAGNTTTAPNEDLISVTIPNSVTNIGEDAFFSCSRLNHIIIPNSVISIGSGAFYGCNSLQTVNIGSGVMSIANGSFSGCSSITSIIVNKDNKYYDSRNDCNAIIKTSTNSLIVGCKKTIIPNGVISIGSSAFSNSKNLTSITLPQSVLSIENGAFQNCHGLEYVNIPSNVTNIGNWAFYGCKSLISLIIPNSVEFIGSQAFTGCSGLTEIIVEEDNNYYDSRNDCNAIINSLTSTLMVGCNNTTIPDDVLSIGWDAFYGCQGITSVILPHGVTSIGHSAFQDCSSLVSVTIPNSVTAIGDWAFFCCKSLTSVIVDIDRPLNITDYTFSNRANASLFVPVGSKAAYMNANYWKEFKEVIEFSGGVINSFTLQITSSGNGVVKYSSTNIKGRTQFFSINEGASATLIFTPDDGYRLGSVKVNGVDMISNVVNNQYTINNISQNTSVSVEFIAVSKFPVAEAVDLGLPSGVKWASWNMGSSSPLDVPNTVYARYGWGDPTGEVHGYGNDYHVSDYAAFGWKTAESKSISGTEYDIATVQWGDKWRMPTIDDFNELNEVSGYTTWEFGYYNDYKGKYYPAWKVTSVKYPDRYIYFPAAGLVKTNGSLENDRSNTNYWTSNDNGYGSANYALLTHNISIVPVPYGTQIPIRPVYGQPVKEPVKINWVRYSHVTTNSASIETTLSGYIADAQLMVVSFGTNESGLTYSETNDNGHIVTTIVKQYDDFALTGLQPNTTYYVKVYVKTESDLLESNIVSFKTLPIQTHTLSITASGTGSVSFDGSTVRNGTRTFEVWKGTDCELSIIPDNGSLMKNVVVNNVDVTSKVFNNRYTISNINQYTTVSVVFEEIPSIITFADSNVKALCVANWDTNKDGELSEAEAAKVKDLGEVFVGNTGITSFDELRYFTGLTSIGSSTFFKCSGLKSIIIPSGVTNIGATAFYGCQGLTDVYCYAENVPNVGANAFEESNIQNATLHVPSASVEAYLQQTPWSEFKEIVAIGGAAKTYTLTYMLDGMVYKTYEVPAGSLITPEPAPIKEGYTFSGWSEIPSKMPAENVTVVGSYTINKYKLIYLVDNQEFKTYEVEYDALITPEPAPTKEGYTFSGWSWIPKKMPAENVTISGRFTINKYRLTYMIDDEVYKVVEYEYDATITPEPQPEGDYITFEWVGLPDKMPAHDVTVTASYVTGIVEISSQQAEQRVYNSKGIAQEKLKKGLNIVVNRNGTTKKVVVK